MCKPAKEEWNLLLKCLPRTTFPTESTTPSLISVSVWSPLIKVTFLPIFLYNEYKNFSNFYFLMLAISQLFPILRVGFLITYFGPIAIILGLSLMKELWDHYKTIQKDGECNSEKFTKLTPQGEEVIRSKDIRVGDFLKLRKNERIPVRLFSLITPGRYDLAAYFRFLRNHFCENWPIGWGNWLEGQRICEVHSGEGKWGSWQYFETFLERLGGSSQWSYLLL